MNSVSRVFLNTISQYVRTIINVVLALYSTRIVLSALGSVDYGLYSVIAGIVAMLSFVTNALVISTQRYLSYYHGRKDLEYVSKVFSNSLIIHILISSILLIFLLSISHLVISDLLSIPYDKLQTSKIVYYIVAAIVSLSFITSPFRALFIARENIVYISIIDIIDGIFKVASAIVLTFYLHNRLILYSIFLACISLFNLLAFALFAGKKYEECVMPTKSKLDKTILKQIFSFANWTIYSSGCVLLRTQGIAVIINRYFGVVVNASFGIAQQIAGALANVSQAIANALSPQIIKAEGENNRTRMLRLAGLECKYSFLMLGIVSIPIIFEMPAILRIWLGNADNDTVLFARFIIITCLCDQITAGLGIANQAIGKIRSYSIFFGTTKLMTIPIAIILLHYVDKSIVVMLSYVGVEFVSSVIRLFFLKKSAGLKIIDFSRRYIIPSVVSATSAIIICSIIQTVTHWEYRLLIMYPLVISVLSVISYAFMHKTEKEILHKSLAKLINSKD